MTFTDDEITIVPGHMTRTWQSCDYYVGRQELFHERTYMRTLPRLGFNREHPPAALLWMASGPDEIPTEQWLSAVGTKPEIEALALKHGGHALEEFYPADAENPLYFLAFKNTDKALAFCRTDDFDRLCLTLEKVS